MGCAFSQPMLDRVVAIPHHPRLQLKAPPPAQPAQASQPSPPSPAKSCKAFESFSLAESHSKGTTMSEWSFGSPRKRTSSPACMRRSEDDPFPMRQSDSFSGLSYVKAKPERPVAIYHLKGTEPSLQAFPDLSETSWMGSTTGLSSWIDVDPEDVSTSTPRRSRCDMAPMLPELEFVSECSIPDILNLSSSSIPSFYSAMSRVSTAVGTGESGSVDASPTLMSMLKSCPWPTLLTLRQVSRDMCRLVDLHMTERVIIQDKPQLIVTVPGHRRLPAMWAWQTLAPSVRDLDTHLQPKVADIIGLPRRSTLPHLPSLLRTVHTVRYHLRQHRGHMDVGEYRYLSADRMVLFVNQSTPSPLQACSIVEGVKKYVLNVAYAPDYAGLIYTGFQAAKTLQQVVVIFTPFNPKMKQPPFTTAEDLGILKAMAHQMCSLLLQVDYTFVDLHTLSPEAFGFTGEHNRAQLQDKILDRLRQRIDDDVVLSVEEKETFKLQTSSIKFLSSAEYRSLIGEKEWTIETVETSLHEYDPPLPGDDDVLPEMPKSGAKKFAASIKSRKDGIKKSVSRVSLKTMPGWKGYM